MFGSLTAAYEYKPGALMLSPYARIETAWSQLGGFTESGGGIHNLIYGAQAVTTLGGTLGLRGEYAWPTAWALFTARGRVEYTRNFTGAGTATLGYADLGTALPYAFSVNPFDSDYATVGLGLDASLPNDVTLGINYRGTTGFGGQDISQTLSMKAMTRF